MTCLLHHPLYEFLCFSVLLFSSNPFQNK
jgi:hypothetical protein